MNRKSPARQDDGFAIAAALALLVICAVMGVFFLKMFNLGQEDAARDASSERAYQAAKAGAEYAAYQSLVAGSCSGSTVALPGFGDLSIALACQRASAVEAGMNVNIDTWTVIACSSASCPGSPSASYVERRVRLVITK